MGLFIYFNIIFVLLTQKTQSTVNIQLEKYQGRWYQIADYPQLYEYFFCNECTRAEYIIQNDNTLRVINQARGFNNCTIKGVANIPNPEESGKLEIVFDPIVFWNYKFENGKIIPVNVKKIKPSTKKGQYWVYHIGDLNQNGLYSWSIVSNENKDTCYILARTPEINNYEEILDIVKNLGFNVTLLKKTIQTNCIY